MTRPYSLAISEELNLAPQQVEATISLFEEGATIPFIARYRKEMTGSLDETVIQTIRDRLGQMEALDKRRDSILKSLEEQDKLTGELEARIREAATLSVLEDIYLPYRPKRRTRAAVAREKGLEPLAQLLFDQSSGTNPVLEASTFVQPEKGVADVEEALSGARDIIAEWVSENAEARAGIREVFLTRGVIRCRVVPGKDAEGIVYRDYFDWEEPLRDVPSHRFLATQRGEKEGFLSVHLFPPEEQPLAILESLFLRNRSAAAQHVKSAMHDSYRRLIAPSLESETRQAAKGRADEEAIRVFVDNLRHLLMAPPLGDQRILAIDPGFRTGCKSVCLDPQGKLLHYETIYPHSGENSAAKAGERIAALVEAFGIEAVAVGNGTAGRETMAFLAGLHLPAEIQVIQVDESGASIYSASPVAREEFPDQDVTVRGAVSIGRRLMDPLAELVKIDPKSIGVGQYQHDVDQGKLRQALDDVVMSCVNGVGVDVNTASPQLLAYVSGIGPQLSRNILAYRNENGPFRSRKDFNKVPRMGPKAFQQASGFLRIRHGDNPLDACAVHPESYQVVEAMARDLGCTVAELMGNEDVRRRIDSACYVSEKVGLPTVSDILAELARPGRDPREGFRPFSFAQGVERIEDLEVGMRLPGIVTNVTAFGAFVDIGVHRDGLVHISELSDRFIKDPSEAVRVHQQVMVSVLEVDLERKRIALSMRTSRTERQKKTAEDNAGHDRVKRKESKAPAPQKRSFNNPFADLLNKPQ